MTRRALVTTTVLLAMAGFALAQSNKEGANQRTIDGVVTDANPGLVAKAIVQFKDMRTLQIRSFVTQADGAYHFAGLRMDTDYEIKAGLDDQTSDPRRVTSCESRKTVTVNLQLGKK